MTTMKYSIKFTLFLIFILSFNSFTQEVAKTDWTNIGSPKGDFTILLPPNFLVDNESNKYRIYAFLDEVAINVQIENDKGAKSRLKLLRQFPFLTEYTTTRFANGDFIGDFYILEKDKKFFVSIYMASSKNFYTVSVSSINGKNATLEKVLNSIKLDNQPLLKQQNPTNYDSDSSLLISSLKTSQIVLDALNIKDAERAKIKYDLKNKDEEATIDDKTKYSRSLIILRKSRANYNDFARSRNISGKVKVQVVFRADGQIGDIIVIQKLDGGLSEAAVEVARKIKFLPAQIEGKSVDITRIVEYNFTLY